MVYEPEKPGSIKVAVTVLEESEPGTITVPVTIAERTGPTHHTAIVRVPDDPEPRGDLVAVVYMQDDPDEKEVAYHEAGHAVIGRALRHITRRPVESASIVPSEDDGSAGRVVFADWSAEDCAYFNDEARWRKEAEGAEDVAEWYREGRRVAIANRRYHQAEVVGLWAGEIAAGVVTGNEKLPHVHGDLWGMDRHLDELGIFISTQSENDEAYGPDAPGWRYLMRLRAIAARLVEANWQAVERVAAALLRHRELTKEQLEELLSRTR